MSEWTQERIEELRRRLQQGSNWRKGERGVHASSYIQLDEVRELLDEIERLCKRIKRTDDDYRELVLETDAREQRLRERIAELEDALRWIPVEERLPEHNTEVLAVDVGEMVFATYMDGIWSVTSSCGWKGESAEVTHWRPLGPYPGKEDP